MWIFLLSLMWPYEGLAETIEPIPANWTYKAAVYEHKPSAIRGQSWQSIEENLNVYEEQIRIASQQGGEILVFPEYGLFGLEMNRTSIYQYLEMVTDPKEEFVNPCIDMIPMARNRIQRRLSCAARWYRIYVVANFGTVEFCNTTSESCPLDGRFQYNTNVIFDSEGLIVGRYRKKNLYFEEQFDSPVKTDLSVFGGPFGSFGTFTSFDNIFKDPAITLIEEVGVVNIAFTLDWSNVLPMFFALGIHEGWAMRIGVNLLSAQLHLPVDIQGSGIYSSQQGALVYYNNASEFSQGHLIIADVITPPKGVPEGYVFVPSSKEKFKIRENFTTIIDDNRFINVLLDVDSSSDELYLEYQNTKCYLKYSNAMFKNNEIFAFGIFEGIHQTSQNSYVQASGVFKCANASRYSCGSETRSTNSLFNTITLAGKFSTDYIFPSLLVDGANPYKVSWEYLLNRNASKGQIQSGNLDKPLLTAFLYTSVYNKDNNTKIVAKNTAQSGGMYNAENKVIAYAPQYGMVKDKGHRPVRYYYAWYILVCTSTIIGIVFILGFVFRSKRNINRIGYIELSS